jgi:hypothetical protein
MLNQHKGFSLNIARGDPIISKAQVNIVHSPSSSSDLVTLLVDTERKNDPRRRSSSDLTRALLERSQLLFP